jgi:hypothetical protein
MSWTVHHNKPKNRRENAKTPRDQLPQLDSFREFPTLGSATKVADSKASERSVSYAGTVYANVPTASPEIPSELPKLPAELPKLPAELPQEVWPDTKMRKVTEVHVPGTNYSKVVTCDDATDVRVAILVSPGYGAGWSSWHGNKQQMCTDSRIIRYLYTDAKNSISYEELMTKYMGFVEIPYDGGFSNLEVEFVPAGSLYKIREYDGAEHVEIFDKSKWNVA